MLSIILFPANYRIPVTVFVVGLSLIFTGYTSAKLGKAPTKPAMLRNLIIGLLTMGVTYFFGHPNDEPRFGLTVVPVKSPTT